MNLAVKHRPTTLDQVVGQKAIVSSIKSIIKRKDIPKSWLFIGPSGTGKTTLARILAGNLIGSEPVLPNFIEIDAAVNNSAEEMRDHTVKSQYRAIGASPIKVYLIDECQNLSGKGFDALLKSTEEPPEHVYWMLCTTNPAKIPETLKTRCIKFTLKPVSEADVFELLLKVSEKEGLSTSPDVLELIAEGCNGSPRLALTNLEACAHVKTTNEARELLRTALQLKGPVDIAKFLLSGRGKYIDAIKLVSSSLENVDAESVRITISNYVAGALMKAKSDDEALRMLSILESFSTPYTTSDKLAPLLLSIGSAMGLGQ